MNIKDYERIKKECQLSEIIYRFNDDYIFEIIDMILDKDVHYQTEVINGVSCVNDKYIKLMNENADNTDLCNELNNRRIELLYEIIRYIGNKLNGLIEIDIANVNPDNCLQVALLVYDIFINYSYNIENFFIQYILKNKSYIYDRYDVAQYKRSKDSDTTYNKKVYKNQKMSIIVSNLDKVISSIVENEDITFEKYIRAIYTNEPHVASYILQYLTDVGGYFKIIVSKIRSTTHSNIRFISRIRLGLFDYSMENYSIASIDTLDFVDEE